MKKYSATSFYQKGIQRYLDENRIPFHMPGHKGKYLTEGIEINLLPNALYKYDITASYERENLYHPMTHLLDSLEQARKVYKTRATYYLVNGSTGGNQAALFATLNPQDKILLPRNIHKLIYGALVATHATPVYLEASYYKNNPLISGIDPAKLEAALSQDKDIKVVYLTNPNYIGACSDIEKLIQVAKSHNKIVIVDEAHGAHFCFHKSLPSSAVAAGADIVIQSTHKTLNALSQTALLHICGEAIDKARVEQSIAMFQTTSPNTLLLLSIETCIVQMQNCGELLLDKAIDIARYVRKSINQNTAIHCYGDDLLTFPFIHAYDETKLYMDVSRLGVTGYEIKESLGKKYHIEAELADCNSLLFSITIADNFSDAEHLISSLYSICGHLAHKKIEPRPEPFPVPSLLNKFQLTPVEAFYAKQEDVTLDHSVGRISAEMIVPYPPGIPILMPGEHISKELVQYIHSLMSVKATFGGSKYTDLSNIVVVKE